MSKKREIDDQLKEFIDWVNKSEEKRNPPPKREEVETLVQEVCPHCHVPVNNCGLVNDKFNYFRFVKNGHVCPMHGEIVPLRKSFAVFTVEVER